MGRLHGHVWRSRPQGLTTSHCSRFALSAPEVRGLTRRWVGWGAASHSPLSLKPRRWLPWVTAETAWITDRQVLKGVVPAVWNTEAPQARYQQHFRQL